MLKRKARAVTTCEYAVVACLIKVERVSSGSGRYVPNLRTYSDRVGLQSCKIGAYIARCTGSNNLIFPVSRDSYCLQQMYCRSRRGRTRRAKEEASKRRQTACC